MADIYEERSDNLGPKGPLFHFDKVCGHVMPACEPTGITNV